MGFCGRCLVIDKSEGTVIVIPFEGFPIYISPICILSLSPVLNCMYAMLYYAIFLEEEC